MIGRRNKQPREPRRRPARPTDEFSHIVYGTDFDEPILEQHPAFVGLVPSGTPEHARVPEPVQDDLAPQPSAEGVVAPQPVDPGFWTTPKPASLSRLTDARNSGADAVGDPGSLGQSKRELARRPVGAYRPSLAADTVEAGGVVLGAVSLRGASHFDHRVVRQDSYALGLSDDESWLIAAIADGVSEAGMSHIGADTAVQAALSLARQALAAPWGIVDWAAVASGVRDAVRARAHSLLDGRASKGGVPVDVSELSDHALALQVGTTAEILVVETAAGLASRRFARIVIAGDGSGFIMDPELGWRVLSIGKPGGKSIGVEALPKDPGAVVVQRGVLRPGQAVLAMTDGFGDPLGDGATEVGGYLATEWAKPLSTVQLVRSASFLRLQADDDRTAVIAWA